MVPKRSIADGASRQTAGDVDRDVATRCQRLDWFEIETSLSTWGHAKTPRLLTPAECRALVAMYTDDRRFRSRVDMARHRFGEGEYKYFDRPLPPLVEALRVHLYERLAPIANRWEEAVGGEPRYPATLAEFLEHCARHGQTRPTPLLLHYEQGGYNCLHQDLYGEIAFPLQVTCFLSRRGVDYEGGDFLLVETRPRAQSIGHALHPEQGEAIIFTTRSRPVRGARGWYRTTMRHGVSPLTRGTRDTLGIIFHDAV